jgi:SRSO17 transposase
LTISKWQCSALLSNDQYTVPVDVRLYLPKEWTGDPERCAKAGIAEAHRSFKTKDELAFEIV